MSRLANVIEDGRGGVFATSLTEQGLRRGTSGASAAFFHLDGAKIDNAMQFLAALGEELKVTDLAESEDWDYLDECLVDLDEFPTDNAFVVFFDKYQRLAGNEPGKWKTILRVFGHAVDEGRERRKPIYIFLGGTPYAEGLPVVDAD